MSARIFVFTCITHMSNAGRNHIGVRIGIVASNIARTRRVCHSTHARFKPFASPSRVDS